MFDWREWEKAVERHVEKITKPAKETGRSSHSAPDTKSNMAEKKSVTFRENLVTDTWFIPKRCISRETHKTKTRRKNKKKRRKNKKRQINNFPTFNRETPEKVWRILTNNENNSDIIGLCRQGRGFRLFQLLQDLFSDLGIDYRNDLDLAEFQLTYGPDSPMPENPEGNDNIEEGLAEFQLTYGQRIETRLYSIYFYIPFQDAFFHDDLPPRSGSQGSQQTTVASSRSSDTLTSSTDSHNHSGGGTNEDSRSSDTITTSTDSRNHSGGGTNEDSRSSDTITTSTDSRNHSGGGSSLSSSSFGASSGGTNEDGNGDSPRDNDQGELGTQDSETDDDTSSEAVASRTRSRSARHEDLPSNSKRHKPN